VPQATIDRAVQYVKSCQHAPSGGFTYQPGRDPGFARTAAAIYSLQVCGLYEDPMVKRGAEYLMKNNDRNEKWFTYGNFYAAPAMYTIWRVRPPSGMGNSRVCCLKNVSGPATPPIGNQSSTPWSDGVGPTY
jgi:hypothetical protein